MEDEKSHPLELAARHCGGITKLAAAIGVGQSVVSNWKARNSVVEAKYCTAIEALEGCPVKRWHLHPDDWHQIWPELIGKEGAPSVPQKAVA